MKITYPWHCPFCNYDNEKGKFCAKCGRPYNEVTWTCPNCGRSDNTGKFCMGCGASNIISMSKESDLVEFAQDKDVSNVKSEEVSKKKSSLAIILVILFCVVAYFGYGFYVEKNYTNKCNDLMDVVSDVGQSMEKIGKLSGNAEADDTKELAEKINGQVEKLDELEKVFTDVKVPDGEENNRQSIITFINADREMIIQVKQILENNDFIIDSESSEKIGGEYKDFIVALQKIEKLNDVTVIGRNLTETAEIEVVDDNIKKYINNKKKRDYESYTERLKTYQQILRNNNEELKKKGELVFLPHEVLTSGQDLVIRGFFYNGTSDVVTGCKEMNVDLTLKNFDSEVLSVNDYHIIKLNMPRVIRPKSQAEWISVLRLPGKASGLGKYNNFSFLAHDIHWNAVKYR